MEHWKSKDNFMCKWVIVWIMGHDKKSESSWPRSCWKVTTSRIFRGLKCPYQDHWVSREGALPYTCLPEASLPWKHLYPEEEWRALGVIVCAAQERRGKLSWLLCTAGAQLAPFLQASSFSLGSKGEAGMLPSLKPKAACLPRYSHHQTLRLSFYST